MGAERRRWPRQIFAQGRLPPTARVRPGAAVTLVNLSRGGALIESALRWRCGVRCDLEWRSIDGVITASSRVTRCFVARLDPSVIRYRTALRFETPALVPAEPDLLAEYQVPGGFASLSGNGVLTAHRGVRPRSAPGKAR